MKIALRLTFHLVVGLMVLGAIAGIVLAVSGFGGGKIEWDDTVVEGATSWIVSGLVGALVGICVAAVIAVVATLVGVIVPILIVAVLAAAAIAIVIAFASVLGSVALALAPVLLLGFGCVLLFRAIAGRSKTPQPLPPI
jgi:hypothetical protein